jgi:hypothetical protein
MEAEGPIFSFSKDGVPTLSTILVGPGETAAELRARMGWQAPGADGGDGDDAPPSPRPKT